MKGRPRKSTAQHKLEGTYQACRHKNNTDVLVANILTVPEKIEVPDEIKALGNKKIEAAFEAHADMLVRLKSVYEVDVPELTHLYLILNDVYKVREKINRLDVWEDLPMYERLQKLFLKQVAAFNALGSKFFFNAASAHANDTGEFAGAQREFEIARTHERGGAEPGAKTDKQKKELRHENGKRSKKNNRRILLGRKDGESKNLCLHEACGQAL